GDHRLKQVVLRLVEGTEVTAPRHVPPDADAGPPQCCGHRVPFAPVSGDARAPIPTWLPASRVADTSGRARLSGRGAYSGDRGREGVPQDLVSVVDEDEGKLPAELLWHVLDVTLVPPRQDHGADARPMSRQDLLLDAPDGKNLAAERDLARHRDVASHRPPRAERGERRHDRHAGGRPVLRDGASR